MRQRIGSRHAVRDDVVRALAKLSLVVCLSALGVFFVGAAGTAYAMPGTGGAAVTGGLGLSDADPLGVLVAALLFAAGIGVLVLGAVKPSRDHRRPGSRHHDDALVD